MNKEQKCVNNMENIVGILFQVECSLKCCRFKYAQVALLKALNESTKVLQCIKEIEKHGNEKNE